MHPSAHLQDNPNACSEAHPASSPREAVWVGPSARVPGNRRLLIPAAALAGLGALAQPAVAEFEVDAYGGYQTAFSSNVKGLNPATQTSYSGDVNWNGESFEMPIYYGGRVAWWRENNHGLAIEYTHAKVVASASDRNALGFDRFEFTNGLNLLTANYMLRWPEALHGLTPYVGAGLGAAFPHVDVLPVGGQRTYGYQLTGVALRFLAGVNYRINEHFVLMTEAQGTHSNHDADLTGGGTLDTGVTTLAINVGIGVSF